MLRAWYGVISLALCGALLGTQAHATLDLVPSSRYTSARAAGMGGAFIPVAEDGASALFYQPAAIGKIVRPIVEPLNLRLSLNDSYVTTLNKNFTKLTNLQAYQPHLQSNDGTWIGAGGAIFPNFAIQGFAFGVLAQTDVVARHYQNEVQHISRYQLIPTVGGAVRLARGIVRLGYSLQWVNEASGNVTQAAGSSTLGYNEQLSEGAGVSHNFGFALTLPMSMSPSLNVVARNLGGMKFSSPVLIPLARNADGRPPDEPMTVDVALGISSKTNAGGAVNLALDWHDMFNRSGVSILGRLALGVEFHFRKKFYVRGGWGSGYPSLGFGIDRSQGSFSVAWYSEEIGDSYHAIRNVNFILQYQIRAF